ncbi:hypothetical protein N7528_000984 [Penicillium herquei]|nr:hypothetical protein N7528_000984 [Penicillium herquei]
MGLDNLPTEVLLEIADCLASISDINSFVRSNRRCWTTLNQYLYVFALKWAEDNRDCRTNRLMWAVENGKLESVQKFIDFCPTKCTTDPPRTLPIIPSLGALIMVAARVADVEMFEKLIAFREGPDDLTSEFEGALGSAISYGRVELIKAILGSGVNLKFTNLPTLTNFDVSNFDIIPAYHIRAMPALHAAAYLGRADIIRLLLDHGVNPYMKDRQGFMALWIATFYGMTEAMRALLEFGVRADGRDRDGQGQEPIPDNIFLDIFLEKLAVYSMGMHLVPRGERRLNSVVPLCVAACLGAEESVRVLLDHGADPNIIDAAGDTPLHLAVLRDNLAVVELLIEKGARLDVSDINERVRGRGTRICSEHSSPANNDQSWESRHNPAPRTLATLPSPS